MINSDQDFFNIIKSFDIHKNNEDALEKLKELLYPQRSDEDKTANENVVL